MIVIMEPHTPSEVVTKIDQDHRPAIFPPGVDPEVSDEIWERYPARAQARQILLDPGHDISVDQIDLVIRRLEAMNRLHLYVEAHAEASDRLRPGQHTVFQDILGFLETYGFSDPRGYNELPTGSGKTVLFGELIKALGLRTLVVAPTTKIKDQNYESMAEFGQAEGVSMGRVDGQHKDVGMHITHTTYWSFVAQTKLGDEGLIRPGDYDLIILDEGHHANAPGTKEALEKHSNAIQIGFTAKADYSEHRRLETVLPVRIHEMSIPEAIDLGLICPYKSIVAKTQTDLSKVPINAGDFSPEELERAINIFQRNQAAIDLYLQCFRPMGVKAIFYCGGVAHAVELARQAETAGIHTAAIYGNLARGVQKRIYDNLALPIAEGGLEVLTNDKLLREGFDEEAIYVVFNLRPSLSLVPPLQGGGRALRNYASDPGKVAWIVDFIDEGYRKSPVIFADPDITGCASVLPEGAVLPELTCDNPYLTLITNDAQIEELAREFSATRLIPPPKQAPIGMLKISEIADQLTTTTNKINEGIRALKQARPDLMEDEDIYGKYKDVETNRNCWHLHTDVIEELKKHIKISEPAPPGWKTAAEIAGKYGVRKDHMRQQLGYFAYRNPKAAKMCVRSDGTGNLARYFSKTVERQAVKEMGMKYFDDGGLPPNWLPESDVLKDIPRPVLESALAVMKSSNRAFVSVSMGEFESAEGSVGNYYSPVLVDKIKQWAVPKSWSEEPVSVISTATGLSEKEIMEVVAELRKRGKIHQGYDSRYCLVEGKAVPYFFKHTAEILISQASRVKQELDYRAKKAKQTQKAQAGRSWQASALVSDGSRSRAPGNSPGGWQGSVGTSGRKSKTRKHTTVAKPDKGDLAVRDIKTRNPHFNVKKGKDRQARKDAIPAQSEQRLEEQVLAQGGDLSALATLRSLISS